MKWTNLWVEVDSDSYRCNGKIRTKTRYMCIMHFAVRSAAVIQDLYS